MTTDLLSNLPYDPKKLKRELTPFYISMSDEEINEILGELGLNSLDDLFNNLPDDIKFSNDDFNIGPHLSYENLIAHLESLAEKNNINTSFIGDGLKRSEVKNIVNYVSNIRGLTTAYTPYQPERSQGTLWGLYLFSNVISALTGFEAVNVSMYERSTCLFEALNTTIKIKRNKNTVLVFESNYPGDLEVINTLAENTNLNIVFIPFNHSQGNTELPIIKDHIEKHTNDLASIAFPQINSLGNLEDVNAITDLCHENNIFSIAVIDPMMISSEGLLPPSQYGENGGADFFVAEGQHMATSPNFGGPGLGIFGCRYNDKNKLHIRSTPGRYTGRGIDTSGNTALTMIMSTREQHIRREKASSNICSNEAFISLICGASLLSRGASGITNSFKQSLSNAEKLFKIFMSFEGFSAKFPNATVINEFVITLPIETKKFLKLAREENLDLGIDISKRLKVKNNNTILLSCFDYQTDNNFQEVENFLIKKFKKITYVGQLPNIPGKFLRKDEVNLPAFSDDELQTFYNKLGAQNVSPDDSIYPLGSCTMKYNPYINDYAANLKGFTELHPQCHEDDAQGSLELLYEIHDIFKRITGLAGVCLQPVAGAQGELVGLKMFQAYHKDNGEGDKRNIILIPKSAHGTNPATSTMAGFITKKIGGVPHGIIEISADSHGQMDMQQLKNILSEYGDRVAGIMVTNPNTSGIFENNFKKMAQMIHNIGGLVYMDGANMNAIAGYVNLNKLGVDAVHNNLHKTWSISHGGGGPGDAIVAVSSKLIDYIPGIQVKKNNNKFETYKAPKSIGSFHRHHGNFAHKIRAYTYLKALGTEGVKKMSAVAVLSARYLFHKLNVVYPTLPENTENIPRMHEFILTLSPNDFSRIQSIGIPKTNIIPQIGKLFLDFGLHAPTVAFPEAFGLMVEPTESFTKSELDRFAEVVLCMRKIIDETPEVLLTVPHFTPVDKVDEVSANKNIQLNIPLNVLPSIPPNRVSPKQLGKMSIDEIYKKIMKAYKEVKN